MIRSMTAGLIALCVFGLAGLWLIGIVAIFDADYNPKAKPDAPLLMAQTTIGGLGIVSLLGAGFCAIRYMRHGGSSTPLKAASLLALALFMAWFALAQGAAAS